MTILSGQTIRRLGIVTPFCERTEAFGLTYGVGPCGYDVRVAAELIIQAGGFVLASTVERFDMPDDVVGVVHDKSTLARIGLAVQNTVIEPGWRGFLTLEISNHATVGFVLSAKHPIAHVLFHHLDAPAERPYDGRYQDQPAEPVKAKFLKEAMHREPCILCANGNDLPEGEICAGCGRDGASLYNK